MSDRERTDGEESLRGRVGEAVDRLGGLRERARGGDGGADDDGGDGDGDAPDSDSGPDPDARDRTAAAVRDRVSAAGDATAAAGASVRDRLPTVVGGDGDGADGIPIEVTEGDGIERTERRARGGRDGDANRPTPDGSDGDGESPALADAAGAALSRARSAAGGVDRRLARTVGRAEPTETGRWAVSGGLWLLAPALAVGYPTALVVGAGALGGAAVGAYASGVEETALDALDPEELPRRAAEGATYGRRYGQYGSAAGALLGGGLYVADSLAPGALEALDLDVDPDAVVRGAASGAERAAENGGDALRAGIAGGGLGALAGYADADAPGDVPLAELLDEDLYREYESRVGGAEGGGALPPEGGPIDLGDAETEGDDRRDRSAGE